MTRFLPHSQHTGWRMYRTLAETKLTVARLEVTIAEAKSGRGVDIG